MNNDKELIKKMVAVCEEYDDEYDVHQVMQAVADVCSKHYRQHDAEKVREELKTINQAILEVAHAQQSGAEWYTKGSSGLYQQVRLWIGKASDSIKAIKQYYGVSDE